MRMGMVPAYVHGHVGLCQARLQAGQREGHGGGGVDEKRCERPDHLQLRGVREQESERERKRAKERETEREGQGEKEREGERGGGEEGEGWRRNAASAPTACRCSGSEAGSYLRLIDSCIRERERGRGGGETLRTPPPPVPSKSHRVCEREREKGGTHTHTHTHTHTDVGRGGGETLPAPQPPAASRRLRVREQASGRERERATESDRAKERERWGERERWREREREREKEREIERFLRRYQHGCQGVILNGCVPSRAISISHGHESDSLMGKLGHIANAEFSRLIHSFITQPKVLRTFLGPVSRVKKREEVSAKTAASRLPPRAGDTTWVYVSDTPMTVKLFSTA